MDPEKDVYPTQFIKMTAEDISAMALVNTTMLNTTQTKFADWITNGGVEEQWDDYLATVKASGIEDNIAKMQQYYDDYMASKQ